MNTKIEQQFRYDTSNRIDGKYPKVLTIDKIEMLGILENIKKLLEYKTELGMDTLNACIEGISKELKENNEIR